MNRRDYMQFRFDGDAAAHRRFARRACGSDAPDALERAGVILRNRSRTYSYRTVAPHGATHRYAAATMQEAVAICAQRVASVVISRTDGGCRPDISDVLSCVTSFMRDTPSARGRNERGEFDNYWSARIAASFLAPRCLKKNRRAYYFAEPISEIVTVAPRDFDHTGAAASLLGSEYRLGFAVASTRYGTGWGRTRTRTVNVLVISRQRGGANRPVEFRLYVRDSSPYGTTRILAPEELDRCYRDASAPGRRWDRPRLFDVPDGASSTAAPAVPHIARRYATLAGYHSSRGTVAFRGNGPAFYGAEFEMVRVGFGYNDHAYVAPLDSNIEFSRYLRAETDSSLSGGASVELISDPMSETVWRGCYDSIRSTLRALIANGYRAHDARCAGLHVHMSRAALDARAEYLISRLFYDTGNRAPWIAASMRETFAVQRWASLEQSSVPTFVNGACRFKIAARARENSRYHGRTVEKATAGDMFGGDRYVALNWGPKTVELRIMRGNLRASRVFGILETVFALYAWSMDRTLSARRCSFKDFAEYVAKHSETYPHALAEVVARALPEFSTTSAVNTAQNGAC